MSMNLEKLVEHLPTPVFVLQGGSLIWQNRAMKSAFPRGTHALTSAAAAMKDGEDALFTGSDDHRWTIHRATVDGQTVITMAHAPEDGSRQVLDVMATPIMMADRHFNITYLNQAADQMFRTYHEELKAVYPRFDVDRLIGTNIDVFHKSPAHNRQKLQTVVHNDFVSRIRVGGLTFDLKLSAKKDRSGQVTDYILVWEDRTQFENYSAELSRVAQASEQGRLSVRGQTQGFEAPFDQMLGQVNDLLDTALAPINDLADKLSHGEQGDLSVRITQQYQGDYQTLTGAFNKMVDSLNATLHKIAGVASKLNGGSSEVSSSAQALANGASKQAAAMEQISAALSEMTEGIQQTAASANDASQLASDINQRARRGDEQMQAMVHAMSEIKESSNSISKIIKVIDEIAFQTNLLALNAAVEAARAGQHGKGFAVVAEEVRNLAARSANAAKETTAMIESIIQKVNQGTTIATETAEALNLILTGVEQTSRLITDISHASEGQANQISQINIGLKQVDQVTQQNTAAAEQSAAAANELTEQAHLLEELLEQFTLTAPPANDGGMPSGLPPELMAALQAYLQRNPQMVTG
ncbi:MAG: methyl-accepting chemotaxis protein [Myxococcota bacterium]